MIVRQTYLEKLKLMRDKKIIKVITGVRRSGKSTLLEMYRDFLVSSGVHPSCCQYINFEDLRWESLKDYHALYNHILENLSPNEKNYIFLDEIQIVPEFQKAINSLFLRDDVDIYITGSNAYLLSGELSTLLSGRYIELSILPLSFKEYWELVGGDKKTAFNKYYLNGGFPYAATIDNKEVRLEYFRGIFNTVLLKDIVERKRISDVKLLEDVIRFLFDNIGNIVSTKKIADTLNSNGRRTTSGTIDNYIRALKDAFILYEANRYDIKSKEFLKSLEKYYIVDIGLRNLLLGERTCDIGHILENIVYLELLRRGYQVSIGKLDLLEVDFIAQKEDKRIYYQVSASVLDEKTYEREFAPLKKINDSYPKYVLTLDEFPMGEDGIEQKNIIDFLLEEN